MLPAEPGEVHALGHTVYNESRMPEFFEYRGPFALCGEHVKVRLSVPFDAEEADVCARCAALVREGRTRRPVSFPRWECGATVRPDLDGYSQMVSCLLDDGHSGPHRGEGATWHFGADDFTPDGDYEVP